MSNVCLRGMTWNHSRALPPLVAASQRFEELHPGTRIVWEKRSLDDFGHAGLPELCRSYDLLVIDHPMLGDAHRSGILVDLQPRLAPGTLSNLKQDALGRCLESYWYEGCLYALPIDAAAPAASFRPDLLERAGCRVPETWSELMDLARLGLVCMPGFPADLFLNFLGLYGSMAGAPANAEQLFDCDVAVPCLEQFRELASCMPAEIYSLNPIAMYESMAGGDRFAYCPFAYTYSNYSRPGFAAHAVLFSNPVLLGEGAPLRTILGGTGMAVSANCAEIDAAVAFSAFVADRDCQKGIYGLCGGQPASRAAWSDPLLNQVSNNFFERTLATMEAAMVRPRYSGYIALQRSAGEPIAAFCRGKGTAAETVQCLNELYRRSIAACGAKELEP